MHWIWAGATCLMLAGCLAPPSPQQAVPDHIVDSFSVSPDGNRIVFSWSGSDRHLRLYRHEATTNTTHTLLERDDRHLVLPAFAPDGQTVAFASIRYFVRGREAAAASTVEILDLRTQSQRVVAALNGAVVSLAFSPQGDSLFVSVAKTWASSRGWSFEGATIHEFVLLDGTMVQWTWLVEDESIDDRLALGLSPMADGRLFWQWVGYNYTDEGWGLFDELVFLDRPGALRQFALGRDAGYAHSPCASRDGWRIVLTKNEQPFAYDSRTGVLEPAGEPIAGAHRFCDDGAGGWVLLRWEGGSGRLSLWHKVEGRAAHRISPT